MADLVAYLDKNPIESYTLGPDVLNVGASGYNELYRAWYEPDVGITFVKTGEYVRSNPTGHHASGSEEFLAAERMSFTFDSGARPWAAINNENSINVFRFSGNYYSSQGSFSGQYPVLYYNLSHNRPEYRFVHCFYLKTGENKIYSRSTQDNFATETVFHQDFRRTVRTLNQAARFEHHPNKLMICGLYENADGFQLVSDCFNYFETGNFVNFSSFSDGSISVLNDFNCSPASNFSEEVYMTYDNFASYPTGDINFLLNSGINMSGGYIWL